jgi:hypothetical protein
VSVRCQVQLADSPLPLVFVDSQGDMLKDHSGSFFEPLDELSTDMLGK